MAARTLMVVGTSSSSGKSLLVTALCRMFARRGIRVAPFKAQNMSNNAAVCGDGSEIGRAQAVQAVAAGIEPTATMNPILLKPEADTRSQVVLMGRPWRDLPARDYYDYKQTLWSTVTRCLDELRTDYELVIVEGAGSPVELNLKPGDLVNMAVADYARAPVLLVGDIDRGGIFAQLLGTLWLLPPEERALVQGLVVNKFRGDICLFGDGVRILEERGGVPVLGVVPYLYDLNIPDEDAVAIDEGKYAPMTAAGKASAKLDIVVIRLPMIANFDDFDPLASEPGVSVRYVTGAQELGSPDAVILPGTKSTVADLNWLRSNGLADRILFLAAQGTPVVGICGGYQMLGRAIHDPGGTEYVAGEAAGRSNSSWQGLGLLPIETTFNAQKTTHRATATITYAPGWLSGLEGQQITGYEIHMGSTNPPRAWLEVNQRSGREVSQPDGAVSRDGLVWGCYIHGLFENTNLRRAWLSALGWQPGLDSLPVDYDPQPAFDRLADQVEAALDLQKLEEIIWS